MLESESNTYYAEDLPIGCPYDLGSYTVTSGSIVEFGLAWDPLPMHVDPIAAEATVFGGLIASGVQSFAIFHRLAVLGAYRHWAVVAGKAIRDLRLTSPVRPGDTLRGELTIVSVQPSRPGRSIVTSVGLLSRGDERVLTVTSENVVRNGPRFKEST